MIEESDMTNQTCFESFKNNLVNRFKFTVDTEMSVEGSENGEGQSSVPLR